MGKSKPLSFGYLHKALSDLTNEPCFTATAIGIFSYTKRHTKSYAWHARSLDKGLKSSRAENFAVSYELFCFFLLYSLSLTPYLSSYLVCMVYSGQWRYSSYRNITVSFANFLLSEFRHLYEYSRIITHSLFLRLNWNNKDIETYFYVFYWKLLNACLFVG